MPEGHPLADRQQSLSLRVARCRRRDAEPLGRAPEQERIPDRLRRRGQQQKPRVLRQRLEPTDKALLDPSRKRVRLEQPEPTGQLRRRQPPWQLQQRQRVAVRLLDDPIAHSLVQLEPHRRAQQRARRRCAAGAPPARGGAQAHRPARAPRIRSRPAPPTAGGRQTPASAPRPDPTTARHRRHTAAGASPPPRRAGSTPPTQPGTDPARALRSLRTRPPPPDAAEPEARRADRAAASTTDADWRRPAPSPTPPPPPAQPSYQTPTRSGTPAVPSSRSRPRPATPTTDSRPGGCSRRAVEDGTLVVPPTQARAKPRSRKTFNHRQRRMVMDAARPDRPRSRPGSPTASR
jgi:hypothetical protein